MNKEHQIALEELKLYGFSYGKEGGFRNLQASVTDISMPGIDFWNLLHTGADFKTFSISLNRCQKLFIYRNRFLKIFDDPESISETFLTPEPISNNF